MKRTERYPEPTTTTERQATQMRRMAGERSVEEAEAAADAAVKRRPYVETGDHRSAEREPKKSATERQADAILRGF